MNERSDTAPIDVDVLEAQRQETNRLAGEIRARILPGLEASLPLLGSAFLGSETKLITDGNGRTKRVPITMDDINEHLDRVQMEAEEADRQRIVGRARAAVEAQEVYFSRSSNEGRKARSQETADFAHAMIDRFLALPLPNAGWEWQKRDPEFVATEEALEHYTRITFSGTPASYSDRRADLDASVAALKLRHNAVWDRVVRLQGEAFKKFLDGFLTQNANAHEQAANFALRLVKDGKNVFSGQEVGQVSYIALGRIDMAQDVLNLKSLSDILPYFQRRTGLPTTFQDLLVPKPQE